MNKNFKAITGSQAAVESMRQINPDVVSIYPICPQTFIIEFFAKLVADGKVDSKIIPAESEHSVMSACVGAEASGARTITSTSSLGLALMWEVLGVASGLRLPIVMHLVMRALSAPINIHSDHSDAMGARDTGWIQLFCGNNQEVYDFSIIAQKLAEKLFLPTMVCQDGFTTSHSVEKTFVLEDNVVKNFVGEFKPDRPLLDVANPTTYGPLSLPNTFTEIKKQQFEIYKNVGLEFLEIGSELSKLTDRKYNLIEEYKTEDAETIIIILASTASTSKVVIDELRAKGQKVGLIRPILFRPFPYQEIAKALSKAKKVAVLDRSIAFGANPPLYSDVMFSLSSQKLQPQVASYIYGLGGHDTVLDDIRKVFQDLEQNKFLPTSQFLYEK
ncbi:MAG: pyruvate ferredoxin oxidoreductase [Patescibacteria group bacterium]|nr:pyruvate ferredoxin oxidoreductase [Patescibacteria group bacterium]